ncbi:MAG: hypothetical protein HeimC2_02930 [Candidatus Heimdallarchaeota archaeon LC_2]|nr:MAG: hypothetical protein HeimC2_02930 [Candidatus Heimdallarchaeota archaeon LC_2]
MKLESCNYIVTKPGFSIVGGMAKRGNTILLNE